VSEPPSHRPLLSVEEAAAMLGHSRSSLYRAVRRGDLPLPLLRISGRWRIPRRAVERLIDGDMGPAAWGRREGRSDDLSMP